MRKKSRRRDMGKCIEIKTNKREGGKKGHFLETLNVGKRMSTHHLYRPKSKEQKKQGGGKTIARQEIVILLLLFFFDVNFCSFFFPQTLPARRSTSSSSASVRATPRCPRAAPSPSTARWPTGEGGCSGQRTDSRWVRMGTNIFFFCLQTSISTFGPFRVEALVANLRPC